MGYEETYNEILNYFKFTADIKGIIHTKTHVTVDNIHNAIIAVGIELNQPINIYIVKAKQLQIEEYRTNQRRLGLLKKNISYFFIEDIDMKVIYKYNFTQEEIKVIEDIIEEGKRKHIRNDGKRYKYNRILFNIGKKIIEKI